MNSAMQPEILHNEAIIVHVDGIQAYVENPAIATIPIAAETPFTKDPLRITHLLESMEEGRQNEEEEKATKLSQAIRRRMLQTNLTDRRALGGILGTAILGIVGLAVGLNVIGIIIGGILGALLGSYAGKRIKENAIRRKKLLNVNIYIIKFAASVQHLLDFNIQEVTVEEVRRLMSVMLQESKMLIMLQSKLKRYERIQVKKVCQRLTKCLKKPKYLFALQEMYWAVKQWCHLRSDVSNEASQHLANISQHEIARACFQFLRPLAKLLLTNSRSLDSKQKQLEQKINKILMNVAVIELRDRYPDFQHQQQESEEEFLHQVYREVELRQLKAMMEDQIAKEILKEDELILQQQQQHQQQQLLLQQQPQYHGNNPQSFFDDGNQQLPICAQLGDAAAAVVNGIDNSNSCQPQQQQYVVWNNMISPRQGGVTNQQQFQSVPNNTTTKSRLIDLIQMASQKKQEEEDNMSASSSSQKNLENYVSVAPNYCQAAQNMANHCSVVHKNEKKKLAEPQQSMPVIAEDQQTNLERSQGESFVRRLDYAQQSLSVASQLMTNKRENGQEEGFIQPKQLVNNGEDEVEFYTGNSSIQPQQSQKETYVITMSVSPTKKAKSNGLLTVPSSMAAVIVPGEVSGDIDAANFQTVSEFHDAAMRKSQQNNIAAQRVYMQNYQQSNQRFKREQLQAAIEELKSDSQVLNQNEIELRKSKVCCNSKKVDEEQVQLGRCSIEIANMADSQLMRKSFARSIKGQEFVKMNSSDSVMKVEAENEEKKNSIVVIEQPAEVVVEETKELQQQQQQRHEVLVEEQKVPTQSQLLQYAKDDQAHVEHVTINVVSLEQNVKVEGEKWDAEIIAKLARLNELDQEDPDKIWERVINKDRIRIYKKQIPKNPSVMVRAEAFIEGCGQEEIFEQIYYAQNRTKWDKVTLGFSVVDKIGEGQDVIYFYIDPGFGVTKRDFLQKRAVKRDYPNAGDITIIFFSIDHPAHPEKKGTIRAISHIAGYIIRKDSADPRSSNLSIITQSDVKGSIPKYIVNLLSARAPAKWIESMRKGVIDHRNASKK